MPSLSPRRNHWAHMPVLPADIAFAPASGARLPGSYVSRLSLRSLSLRPGCLLTVLATALSTGSRQSITLPPAVRATRLRALVMVGLLSYRMYLPCLDARDGHIKSEGKRGPRPGSGIIMSLMAGRAMKPLWGRSSSGIWFLKPLRGTEIGRRQVAGKPLRGHGARLVSRPIEALRAVQQ